MTEKRTSTSTAATDATDIQRNYQPPTFEVIELGCEITAYAPVGDDPLF